MKKYLLLTIFIFLFAACKDDFPKIVEGQINPGDEVDGMLFQPIEEMDWNISLAFLCDDETTPLEAEQNIIDALESCGAEPQITIFPNVGHDLDLEKINPSDLYAWFLEHGKK